MANLMHTKLKGVYKLLSERRLTFVTDFSDDLKCGICKDILIDAQLTECGCNFCKKCIDQYRNNKGLSCPGKTDECKHSDLSNIVFNNSVNRQISRLIVRCDEDYCDFKCELINMDSHLEKCSNKKLSCPFNIVGCEVELNVDKMNDHLRLESYSHNKLLMEMINNLRNEINELKENGRNNQCDISRLRIDTERNNNDIEMLKNVNGEKKIESEMKEDVEKIKMELKICQEMVLNNERKLNDSRGDTIMTKDEKLMNTDLDFPQVARRDIENAIFSSISSTLQDEHMRSSNEDMKSIQEIEVQVMDSIRTMSTKYDELLNKIEKLNENGQKGDRLIGTLWRKVDDLKKDLKINETKDIGENETIDKSNGEVSHDDFAPLLDESSTSEKNASENGLTEIKYYVDNEYEEMKKRIDRMEKYIDRRIGIYVWNIGPLEKLTKVTNRWSDSDCFYDRNNFYKLALRLYSDSWYFVISGDDCNFRLLVFIGDLSDEVEWSFKANVTIKISNKLEPKKTVSIKKECIINEVFQEYDYSEPFVFSKSKLIDLELFNNPHCIITCYIDYL